MWPFRKRVPSDDVQACRASISELSGQVARLREDHEDLKERFTSLRGRVYHAGLHKVGLSDEAQPSASPPSPAVDSRTARSQKLTQAGFVPGKPFPHKV